MSCWRADRVRPSPSARGGHCCTALPSGGCLLLGGADRLGNVYADVWQLHTGRLAPLPSDVASFYIRQSDPVTGETLRWEHRPTTAAAGAAALEALTGASATAVGHRVFVFGGQDPVSGKCTNNVGVLDTGAPLSGRP